MHIITIRFYERKMFTYFIIILACSEDPDVPCLMNGSEVLDQYEFTESNLMPHIYSMIWIYIGFHVTSFVCFVARARLNKLS